MRLRRRGVEGTLEASIQALYHALEFIRDQDRPDDSVPAPSAAAGRRAAPRRLDGAARRRRNERETDVTGSRRSRAGRTSSPAAAGTPSSSARRPPGGRRRQRGAHRLPRRVSRLPATRITILAGEKSREQASRASSGLSTPAELDRRLAAVTIDQLPPMTADLVVLHARQLMTCAGPAPRRGAASRCRRDRGRRALPHCAAASSLPDRPRTCHAASATAPASRPRSRGGTRRAGIRRRAHARRVRRRSPRRAAPAARRRDLRGDRRSRRRHRLDRRATRAASEGELVAQPRRRASTRCWRAARPPARSRAATD